MTIDRRSLLGAAGAGLLVVAGRAGAAARSSASGVGDARFRTITDALQAPEGPKPQADGSVIVCEMARGTLSRVRPDGSVQVIAELGGAPNGVAIGPDGAAYVCNNGGFKFRREGTRIIPSGPLDTPGPAGIQRVELRTGQASTLYRAIGDAPLRAPNDLVFDASGGFWFTDPQAPFAGQQGTGTVNYARPDGKEIRVVCGLAGNNGIALSPDGRTLYVARTQAAEVVAFDVVAPGRVAVDDRGQPRSRVLGKLGESGFGFDSLAVDVAGNLIVGTLNLGAEGDGCLTVMAPDGRITQRIALPEKFVTSVGFGGPDRRTAFITLTQTGRLVALDWPRAGLKLAGG